jgi:hypothetical protein
VQLGDSVVDAQVLNDSGGYHLILQHPNAPNFIIRQRKAGATPVATGLANMDNLARGLQRVTKGAIRTPAVMQGGPDAYIVEKVSGTADALAMWNELSSIDKFSPRAGVLRTRLQAIRDVVAENMTAMQGKRNEPFPDFRPANVGVVDGRPELVYIDFDQQGEVKDEATLADQIMEWAGRRYDQDPGGARLADQGLWKFLTGQN